MSQRKNKATTKSSKLKNAAIVAAAGAGLLILKGSLEARNRVDLSAEQFDVTSISENLKDKYGEDSSIYTSFNSIAEQITENENTKDKDTISSIARNTSDLLLYTVKADISDAYNQTQLVPELHTSPSYITINSHSDPDISPRNTITAIIGDNSRTYYIDDNTNLHEIIDDATDIQGHDYTSLSEDFFTDMNYLSNENVVSMHRDEKGSVSFTDSNSSPTLIYPTAPRTIDSEEQEK